MQITVRNSEKIPPKSTPTSPWNRTRKGRFSSCSVYLLEIEKTDKIVETRTKHLRKPGQNIHNIFQKMIASNFKHHKRKFLVTKIRRH